MRSMTPRQRIAAALNHQEPDRVPISIGGTAHKITDPLFNKLVKHFRVASQPMRVLTGISFSLYDDHLLDTLGTDTRYVHMRAPKPYKKRIYDDGSYDNEWGITFRDESYFTAVVGHPLAEATLEDLDRYPWPQVRDPQRVAGVRERARTLYEDTDYAVVAYRPVPSGLFETACMLRGTEEFLVDMVINVDFASALLERIMEVQNELYRQQLETVAPYVQVVEMLDDYGSQSGLLFSPRLYRELLQPLHRRQIALIREKAASVKILFHSCGAIAALIPDLIETGFDILNPLQPMAKGMNPAELKKDFGDRLCFLGGVDVQQTMRGDVEDVKQEVIDRIRALAPGGGFILAPSHNLFEDVPLENVLCMLDTAKEHGRYPVAS